MTHCQAIQQALVSQKLDALLLTSPVNRAYVTGFQSSAGWALLLPNAAYFMTDFRYFEAAQARIGASLAVRLASREQPARKQIAELLTHYNVKKLGIEADFMTVSEQTQWKKYITAKMAEAQELLQNARQIKDKAELTAITRAQRMAEQEIGRASCRERV